MMNEFIKNVEEVAENFKKALVKMGINLQNQKVGGYIETHGMMHPDEVVWPSSKRMPLQPTKAEVDQVAKNNEHLDHPFYKKVDEITAEVAMQQILKGAEKYDEPFNPDSWTGEELGNHALEELRDGQVYVVGMVEKIKGLEEENGYLKERLNNQNEDTYIHLSHEIKELKAQLEASNGLTKSLSEENKALKEENERLKEEITFWKESSKEWEEIAESLRKLAVDELKENHHDVVFNFAVVINTMAEQINKLNVENLELKNKLI